MNSYIVLASWEDRFINSVKKDIDCSEINTVYCFYFEEFYGVTEKEIKKLQDFLTEKSINLVKIQLKFNDYIFSWKKVKDTFSSKIKENKVKLNISTMTRNMIFCMLHFLIKGQIKYSVIYYPAKEHSNQPTTNPLKPHIVLQHGGIMYPEKKTFLVIFVGYDRERVDQLYNYFEPHKVHLVSVDKNFTNTPNNYSNAFNILNLENSSIPDPSHECTFNELNKILTEEYLEKYNILLCSLGAKIGAIGIYKFYKSHPKTALLYAPSKDYDSAYSIGVDLKNPKTVDSSWVDSS